MKKLFILILTVSFIVSCATTGKNVTQVEYTPRQNWINLGRTVFGVALSIFGYAIISKQQSEAMRDGLYNMPMPVITVPIGGMP